MADVDYPDYYIDEDDIRYRRYGHAVESTYVASLLLMGMVFTLLHVISSHFVTDFIFINMIWLMLTIDVGLYAFQRASNRLRPAPDPFPFALILVLILFTGIASQLFFTIFNKSVRSCVFLFLELGVISLVATMILLLLLLLILM